MQVTRCFQNYIARHLCIKPLAFTLRLLLLDNEWTNSLANMDWTNFNCRRWKRCGCSKGTNETKISVWRCV